jgi:hypothetical protein
MVATLSLVAAVAPQKSEAQWRFGGSAEFFAPIGDLAEISLLGLSFDAYASHALVRRKLAVTVDAGIHWFIPDELNAADLPDWVGDVDVGQDGRVTFSGSFIPIRGSLTLLFGRFYVSPRVGAYISAGDFRRDLDLGTKWGIAPRTGYLFVISPGVQFDFALEYDYLFGDESLQYVGFGLGLFFGGRRLARYY